VSVVVSEGLQLLLPLAGLFDVEKELKRLDKQKQKVGPLIWLAGEQHLQ
jgi:valyl-tRNA synthetase